MSDWRGVLEPETRLAFNSMFLLQADVFRPSRSDAGHPSTGRCTYDKLPDETPCSQSAQHALTIGLCLSLQYSCCACLTSLQDMSSCFAKVTTGGSSLCRSPGPLLWERRAEVAWVLMSSLVTNPDLGKRGVRKVMSCQRTCARTACA